MGLRVLSPMLATTRPPTEPAEWVFEPKLDGWRCLVYVDETVTVRTRTGRDITANVPHLQGLAGLGRRVVLDGELVADAGRARDFYQVGGRLRSNGATGETTFVAFDLLVLDGELVCEWSYRAACRARVARSARARVTARSARSTRDRASCSTRARRSASRESSRSASTVPIVAVSGGAATSDSPSAFSALVIALLACCAIGERFRLAQQILH